MSYLSSSTGSDRCYSRSEGRKKIEEVHHNLQQEWIDQNKICLYDQIVGNLDEHLQSFKNSALYKSNEKELLLYQIKILSNGNSPFLSFSLRVIESLEVDVWLNGIRLISSDLDWLQLQDNKISNWSQMENLLARFRNAEKEAECFEMSDKSLIEHANVFISKVTTDANKELRCFL